MTGVDVDVDINVGKHLSSLGQTLTAITGNVEEEALGPGAGGVGGVITPSSTSGSISDDELEDGIVFKKQKNQTVDLDLPSFLFDPSLDRNTKAKFLDHEITDQAKIVEDLQQLQASEPLLSSEMKKLEVLQNIASKNFRQDIVQRLRRQKSKASSIREKFGLGPSGGGVISALGHRLNKAKSVSISSPSKEVVGFPVFAGLKRIKSGEVLVAKNEFELEEEDEEEEEEEKFRRHDYDESPHFPRDKN